MQKIEIFWGSAQTPLGSLQHSSLAGGRGLLAAPSPKTPLPAISHFGARPCETVPWVRFTPHGKFFFG